MHLSRVLTKPCRRQLLVNFNEIFSTDVPEMVLLFLKRRKKDVGISRQNIALQHIQNLEVDTHENYHFNVCKLRRIAPTSHKLQRVYIRCSPDADS